ncbi:MAG TPA: hypothetical protein VE198_11915, partial [Actinoallomurus sp.]|nr:hypothetical protein [Actinoallomurus sp.]
MITEWTLRRRTTPKDARRDDHLSGTAAMADPAVVDAHTTVGRGRVTARGGVRGPAGGTGGHGAS